MYYVMGRTLALSQDSALKAIESLQNSSAVLPPHAFVSASLASRQIKAIMKLLLEQSIQDLLRVMEKELRKDWRSWATCFCTILILCILIEQVQAAIDGLVVDKLSREGQDAADIRKRGIKACQALEEPINYAWDLFRGIQGKYEPVKNGRPISPQNQGEAELINEIREMMSDDGISP
jgi:hypothetical protein